ncbi:hypothetical protein MAR_034760 [Mya arenaria]|uniref:G-protein coupled receptors family 1 profile domain-containing protein n=1 Tax=Mya arenaria TaxID=6604 RepID=A0ABY7EKZ7_MYAAR|nr:hypothetical protein MAR_034760 [Mya arenaria]
MEQLGPKLKCTLKMEYIQFLNIETWVDTFLTMVIPFFIIILVNSLVLRTIIREPLQTMHSVVILKRKKPHSAHKKVDTFVILGSMKKTFCKPTNPQIRVTRTLIMVSMTFLCLNLPSHAVTMVLYYVTFSCNFVIYTLFGRKFKSSLMLILKCRSTTEEQRRLLLKG